jgi:hypothetical protein
MREYPQEAIDRARQDALEWLEEHREGWPQSWDEIARGDKLRSYEMYDDFQAPPIAGYEALEREGLVVRVGLVTRQDGQERVHFRSNVA